MMLSSIITKGQQALLIKNGGDSIRTKITAVSKDVLYTAHGNVAVLEVSKLILSKEEDSSGTLATIFRDKTEINPAILEIPYRDPVVSNPTYQDWVIENKDATWRKVYRHSGDSLTLMNIMTRQLQSVTYLQFDIVDGTIVGKIHDWTIDYRKYGATYMSTSFIFSKGKWSGRFLIEFRQGRYRVTVSNLYVDLGSVSVNSYGTVGFGSSQEVSSTWSEIFLTKKRDTFRPGKVSDATFLSVVISDLFEAKNRESKKDDW